MGAAQWRKWKAKFARQANGLVGDQPTQVEFGVKLLELLFEATADDDDPLRGKFYESLERRGKKENVHVFKVREDVAVALLNPATRADAVPPRLQPMLVAPELMALCGRQQNRRRLPANAGATADSTILHWL